MKPPRFDYERVEGVEAALARLAELGDDARVLAGGQSLVPMLNMRVAAPQVLLDIGRVAALGGIAERPGALVVGATCRQAELERWPGLAARVPLLALALPAIGHYQTRARGTVGGSIVHADPSAELPLVAAVLAAEVGLRSHAGERRVAAREFFKGALETARTDEELLTEVVFPLAIPGGGYAFEEVAMRHGDFAIVAVAALARPGGLVLGAAGLADAPVVREWPHIEGDALADALAELGREVEVLSDQHASASYRRMLLATLGTRVAARARAGAAG